MNTARFDNAACLTYLNEHVTAFEVADLFPLQVFTDLIGTIDSCTLECSCKIERRELHPARFNVWFQDDDLAAQMEMVFGFFRKVESQAGVTLDYDLFRSYYTDDFDLTRTDCVVTGVDLREDMRDSRLKIWFKLGDYPEKVEAAMALGRHADNLRELVVGPGFLVGFDFCLDGRTAIKIYPRIERPQLRHADIRDRLAKVLAPRVMALLDASAWAHISLAKDDGDRILHCRPLDLQGFLPAHVRNATVNDVVDRYRDKQVFDTVVSMRETEYLAANVQDVNVYFMVGALRSDPASPRG